MIICSCTLITSDDIDRTVAWMKAADPQAVVTPGKVFRALGKQAVCGGCAKLFVAAVHNPAKSDVPTELRNLRMVIKGTGDDEGQRKGYRVPQQSAQA